jgi:hypothetical protein
MENVFYILWCLIPTITWGKILENTSFSRKTKLNLGHQKNLYVDVPLKLF